MGGRGITGEVAASQCDARTFMNEATSSMNSAMGSPTVPAAEPDAAESISNPDAKIVLLNEQRGRSLEVQYSSSTRQLHLGRVH